MNLKYEGIMIRKLIKKMHEMRGIIPGFLLFAMACPIFAQETGISQLNKATGDAVENLVAYQRDSTNGITVYFPLNKSQLKGEYYDNIRALGQLKSLLRDEDFLSNIDSIVVNAYASPEGGVLYNMRLAADRARSVKMNIMQRFPYVGHDKIITRSRLVDWQEVKKLISEDRQMPFREEAIAILSIEALSDVQRLERLKIAGRGAAFDYIIKYYADFLRRATSVVYYTKEYIQRMEQAKKPSEEKVEPLSRVDTVYINSNDEWVRKPLFALKTNLLFDLASAVNFEIEIPIGKHWSIAGEYIFPWWLWENKQYCLQTLSGSLEARYWLGNREERPLLTGWFLGAYAGAGYYDIEWASKGYQGEFYIASGLSGGFAHGLNKSGSLRMEYSLGFGYLSTKYREYNPIYGPDFGLEDKWFLIRQKSGNYTWIGPTRAKISLVWMINSGYKRKGGSK